MTAVTPSPSPPSFPSSLSPSPHSQHASLSPSLASAQAESSQSRTTPGYASVDLPTKQTVLSGCWTCRLRQKKCDGQREGDTCQTCKRLTIKCLGWGAKRPEWMRDKRAVEEYRAGIKEQLSRASLIRGRSTVAVPSKDSAAATVARPPIYRAAALGVTPFTASSLPSYSQEDQPFFNPGELQRIMLLPPDISNDPHRTPELIPDKTDQQTPLHPGEGLNDQRMPPSPTRNYGPDVSEHTHSYPESDYPSFTWMLSDLERRMRAFVFSGQDTTPRNLFTTPESSRHSLRATHLDDSDHDWKPDFFAFYGKHVVSRQYLLATPLTRWMVTIPGHAGSTFEQAIIVLLSVYLSRLVDPTVESVLLSPMAQQVTFGLGITLYKQRDNLTPDDAMAALSLISAVLFDGGGGIWLEDLNTASHYVEVKMAELKGIVDGIEKLQRLSAKDAFIVKTTIWFDVLASVTTFQEPLLLDCIRVLFKPPRASPGPERDYKTPEEEKTSMLSPMGCENNVVWALAEISALSVWKKKKNSDVKSPPAFFARRVELIEKELNGYHSIKSLADFNDDPVVYVRYLTAQIFRTSALLYLHAVMLGTSMAPTSLKIRRAVDDVLRWIHRIPRKPQAARDKMIHKSVVRSTVFAFYITGALADDDVTRRVVKEYLSDEAREEAIGNCEATVQILENIWDEKDEVTEDRKGEHWREKLRSLSAPLLLV